MAQIRLFKALGLRVKAESELKRWEEEIEKDLKRHEQDGSE